MHTRHILILCFYNFYGPNPSIENLTIIIWMWIFNLFVGVNTNAVTEVIMTWTGQVSSCWLIRKPHELCFLIHVEI
jgi:hypothetical protein